ncbi:hypothetical protein [Mycolicibacterium aichiense]|uniref:Secreted protein n=1 Tax=Mycolicibacterium aichiense TaxID=1799 RepID=A0AAD1MBQ5_9MYCO|nr:hypothetical protein [Mycolicibacterium aichiense]MCV7019800.1 hypothetical protein [Mycolicibacterium aichiense]BBX06825.1 hypothetical protein MAIC_16280 [Mycolicibacterium aichiense]STZ80641.1 Uncharacterised protein [Mycolicibacterium aichiense]
MIRPTYVVLTAFAVALGGVAVTAPVASAGPLPPCTYTLTPPVVGPGGVTATADLAGCGPGGGPYLAVACLLGTDGVTHCTQAHGSDPAVISVPYQPGFTYIATGRGCPVWMGQNVAPDCQLLGPFTATL